MPELHVASYDDGHVRGYFPVVEKQAMLDQHVWWAWVSGLWHAGTDPLSDDFAPGRALTLVPDPENPHDPKAVGVWNAKQSKRAGWIPRSVAEGMAVADRVGVALLESIDESRRTALFIAVSREPIELMVAAEPMSKHVRSNLQRWLRRRPVHQAPGMDPIEAMRRMLSNGT